MDKTYNVYVLEFYSNGITATMEQFTSEKEVCKFIDNALNGPGTWSIIYVLPHAVCNERTIQICSRSACIGSIDELSELEKILDASRDKEEGWLSSG